MYEKALDGLPAALYLRSPKRGFSRCGGLQGDLENATMTYSRESVTLDALTFDASTVSIHCRVDTRRRLMWGGRQVQSCAPSQHILVVAVTYRRHIPHISRTPK